MASDDPDGAGPAARGRRVDGPYSPGARIDQRRRQVTDAARALFVDNGFHSTGMAQIAAASGIKIGQIYRDFTGKADIVAGIVREDLDRILAVETLDRAIASGEMAEVRRWIVGFICHEADVRKARLLPEIIAEAGRNEAIAAQLAEAEQRVRDTVMRALVAVAPGEARAIRRAAFLELILTLGIGLPQKICAMPPARMDELCDQFAGLISREIAHLLH